MESVMAVKGVFSSDSGIVGDPKGDFAAAILQEVPTGSAPLFALTSGMPSAPATDTIINWFEEQHISGRSINSGGLTAFNAAPITVDDASSYTPGVILMVEATGEYVYVTAIAANVLTVVRGFAGTTAAAIPALGALQRIGTAFEEGSAAPQGVTNLGFPVFNYTQIFRNVWSLTGTAEAVQYYTGSQVAKNKRDAMLFHSEDIERSIIWGKKVAGTKNGQPFRTMDGLDAFITTNVTAAGVSTNYDDMESFLRDIFAKNIKGKPNERIAFCGNQAISVLNGIARIEGRMEIQVGQTDFGLNVSKWISPFGTITLMTHPLMNESPLWTGDIRVYHPGAIRTRYLRPTIQDDYDRNGTRAGADADYGVITTEMSVEYNVERTGGRLTGLAAAAAV
jgi:hypothetical protein